MDGRNNLDGIDQNILRILSLYGHLNLLDLWYEIGEDKRQEERLTEEEVLNRLEALRARGFVKCIFGVNGTRDWACLRREVGR